MSSSQGSGIDSTEPDCEFFVAGVVLADYASAASRRQRNPTACSNGRVPNGSAAELRPRRGFPLVGYTRRRNTMSIRRKLAASLLAGTAGAIALPGVAAEVIEITTPATTRYYVAPATTYYAPATTTYYYTEPARTYYYEP